MKDQIDITPETKLGKLLDAYPELEPELASMSPAFAKLQNPLLRKTVVKVATLKQVAEVGNISLGDLINRLRQKVGIVEEFSEGDSEINKMSKPQWLHSESIAKTLDARPILAAGGHPIEQVMQELARLNEGQVFELITPFLPSPLLDRARQKNYFVWSEKTEPDLVKSYFKKKGN